MKIRWNIVILTGAILTCVPLYYYDANPEYFAQATIEPIAAVGSSPLQGFAPLSNGIMTRISDDGAGFFELVAQISQQISAAPEGHGKLFLEISPQEVREYFRQAEPLGVLDRTILGKFQLGSKEYPLHRDESYAYHIVTDQGTLVAAGRISARVYRVQDVPGRLITGIGILASLLHVLTSALYGRLFGNLPAH